MKQAQIRLTATIVDTDGGQVDGWLNRKFSGDFEVYEDKDQAEVYTFDLGDGFGATADNDDAIEQEIVRLIGSLDSYDGETAYAADARIGTTHGMSALIAAHVEIVSVPDWQRAVISVKTHNDFKSIPAYLPGNYRVVGSVKDFDPFGTVGLVIEGQDAAGWTLEDYVLPRLASGLHFGRELEDGELSLWIEEGKYAALANQDAPAFEVVQELEYDVATDTLTEVN